MELDDELKLRVETRLIDKSTTTWWDNLKLQAIAPMTWDLFVQEFNEVLYPFPQGSKEARIFQIKIVWEISYRV